MTPRSIHPFSQQEIMAYLDGELAPERALGAAQHLEDCRECRELVEDMKHVALSLRNWTVEPNPASLPPVDTEPKRKPRWPSWKIAALVVPSAAAMLVLISFGITQSGGRIVRMRENVTPAPMAESPAPPQTPERRSALMAPRAGMEPAFKAAPDTFVATEDAAPATPVPPNAESGPLVVRTAQLTITTRNFEASRAAVDGIVGKAHGYTAQLEFASAPDSGRTMDVTIRVPAASLQSVLQSLRTLGHVDSESQQGEDVTQRSVDLNARLSNLQTAETRLLQILRDRTGRLSEVLQVEQAVDTTRGEIEVAKAEQKTLANQVAFASVRLRVVEQYRAALTAGGNSTLTRLRNAMVEGYRNLVDLIVGLVAFLFAVGPTLLAIAALGFFPVRWIWRRRASLLTGS